MESLRHKAKELRVPKLMKFTEICAEVLVPKFTRAEVRLPGQRVLYNKILRLHFFHWSISNTSSIGPNPEYIDFEKEPGMDDQ